MTLSSHQHRPSIRSRAAYRRFTYGIRWEPQGPCALADHSAMAESHQCHRSYHDSSASKEQFVAFAQDTLE